MKSSKRIVINNTILDIENGYSRNEAYYGCKILSWYDIQLRLVLISLSTYVLSQEYIQSKEMKNGDLPFLGLEVCCRDDDFQFLDLIGQLCGQLGGALLSFLRSSVLVLTSGKPIHNTVDEEHGNDY